MTIQHRNHKNLVVNKVKCLACGEELESRHRHDYRTCNCEQQTMVDGGIDYGRYGGVNLDLVELCYVYDDEPHEKLRNVATWGTFGKTGEDPLRFVRIAEMSNDHIDAILTKFKGNVHPTYKKLFEDEMVYRTDNNITITD